MLQKLNTAKVKEDDAVKLNVNLPGIIKSPSIDFCINNKKKQICSLAG